jgi:superfamily II DNA/RNA helicase
VERTSAYLTEKGVNNQFYHGAMEQQERDSALCKFRNGTTQVLVTTDLASRGLDIAHIRYIVHYHLPLTEDSFTHRNGRTARMDASGTAILILSPEEKLPAYVDKQTEEIELPEQAVIPEKPKWITLFVAAGKKDKLNQVDIVGFLTNKGQLKKEDIGLIEVKDFFSFVAIRKTKATNAIELIKNEKIKGKKIKIEIAVNDDFLQTTVEAITRGSRDKDGYVGSGKIFVLPVENVIRIRTNESGRDAI